MQTFWYRRLLLKDSKMLKNLEAEISNDPSVQVCLSSCVLSATDLQNQSITCGWQSCVLSHLLNCYTLSQSKLRTTCIVEHFADSSEF